MKQYYGVAEVAFFDINENRLNMARNTGVDYFFNDANKVSASFDTVFDAAGHEDVLKTAMRVIKHGGSLYISAIYEEIPVFDINQVVSGELRVVGCNNYTFADIEQAARVVCEQQLDFGWLISDVIAPEDIGQMFKSLTSRGNQHLKVLIKF